MAEVQICVLGLGGQSVFLEVEHFHRPGETLSCKSLYREPGGKGYNQAVAASRLGARVRFLGAVGDDGDGRECRDFLVKQGVEPALEVIRDAPTAYACILTDCAGENRVTVCRGAAEKLSASFVRECEKEIAQSDWLLLNFETPPAANRAALELAKQHGVRVLVNPAPFCEAQAALLRDAFVITPNRREALSLLRLPETAGTENIASALRAENYARAVVTLGGEGALVFEKGETALLPAERCRAVDTTGAGDCFSAALAVSLGQGKSPCEAARRAIRAAAFSVQRKHVMQSLPYQADLCEE